jgi:hypothetical protein
MRKLELGHHKLVQSPEWRLLLVAQRLGTRVSPCAGPGQLETTPRLVGVATDERILPVQVGIGCGGPREQDKLLAGDRDALLARNRPLRRVTDRSR